MKVMVIAPFELHGQAPDGTVELPDGARLFDLLRRAIHPPVYTLLLPISVNGEQAKRSRVLQHGDLVVFILPHTGG